MSYVINCLILSKKTGLTVITLSGTYCNNKKLLHILMSSMMKVIKSALNYLFQTFLISFHMHTPHKYSD